MLEKVCLDFNKTCNKVSQATLGLGFVILGTTDILGRIILCSGDGLVHCRMFSSTHGLNATH